MNPGDIQVVSAGTNDIRALSPGASLMLDLAQARWNAVIPKCAKRVTEVGDSSLKYLHPTKGWRYVHKRRLKVFG